MPAPNSQSWLELVTATTFKFQDSRVCEGRTMRNCLKCQELDKISFCSTSITILITILYINILVLSPLPR